MKEESTKRSEKQLGVLHLWIGGKDCFSAPDYRNLQDWDAAFGKQTIANLDRLSWLMLDELRQFKDGNKGESACVPGSDKGSERRGWLFSFESEEDWESELDFDKAMVIGELIRAYRDAALAKRKFEKNRRYFEKRNDFAKACYILRARPDADYAARADVDARLRDALWRIESYFESHPDTSLNEAIDGLKSSDYTGWPFLAVDEREGYLKSLLPGFQADDSFRDIVLENRQRGGYLILFYLLRAAERDAELRKEFNLSDWSESAYDVLDVKFFYKMSDLTDGATDRHPTYSRIHDEYLDYLGEEAKACLRDKRSWDEWERAVVQGFRTRVEKWCEDGLTDLVKYLSSLRVKHENSVYVHEGKCYFHRGSSREEKRLFWSLLEWDDVDGYIIEDSAM